MGEGGQSRRGVLCVGCLRHSGWAILPQIAAVGRAGTVPCRILAGIAGIEFASHGL